MTESFINIFTILNLTILASLLWFKQDETKASKFLSVVVFSPGTPFILNYLIYTGDIKEYPWLQLLSFGHLWAPAVLFYVRAVLIMNFSTSMLWPHFIPQAICTSLWLICINKGRDYTDVLFDNVFHGQFPWEITLLNFLLLIQALGYLTYSAVLINRQYPFHLSEHIKKIILQPETFLLRNSENEKNYRGKWLKHFIGLSISINLIAIILYISFPEKEVSYIYVPVLYNFIYILIVYKSFRYSPIFMPADSSKVFRYSGSSLSKEQSHDCYLKVISLIREEKLYLHFELKLEDIANRLNLSTQYVSQAINQNGNKNFFEFINSYRIEEAKKLLKERPDLTIEAIAYDSGFGSKAAFNRTFKKSTGQTPSEFIKTSLQLSILIILLVFA